MSIRCLSMLLFVNSRYNLGENYKKLPEESNFWSPESDRIGWKRHLRKRTLALQNNCHFLQESLCVGSFRYNLQQGVIVFKTDSMRLENRSSFRIIMISRTLKNQFLRLFSFTSVLCKLTKPSKNRDTPARVLGQVRFGKNLNIIHKASIETLLTQF